MGNVQKDSHCSWNKADYFSLGLKTFQCFSLMLLKLECEYTMKLLNDSDLVDP